MSQVEAVEAWVGRLRERDPDVVFSPLVATARVMAVELDSPDVSATAKSMCGRVLLKVVEQVEAGLPPVAEKGRLDELEAAREARRRRAASGG